MTTDRRALLAAAGASATASGLGGEAAAKGAGFPKGLLWGAATAGH
jgi:hypothetical protein